MTVVDDRIEMAEDNAERLDQWFERLERMPVPEGMRVEVVEGAVFMTPQRSTHWHVIRRIVHALESRFGLDVPALSDVRIDFPGKENGFCPDVALLRAGSTPDGAGRWRARDVEFVAEVISRGTAQNDYGPKKTAYARAEVPVYLIVDTYQGRCHLYTDPKEGGYTTELTVAFGADLDLTGTPLGLTLPTDGFPREET